MRPEIISVIVAHPDDEVLGCGGSIAKWIQDGNEVHVLIMAEGVTSRDSTRNRELRKEELEGLIQAAHAANEVLGVKSVTVERFPDNRLDSIDRLDIIKRIEGFVDKLKPQVVCTHFGGDINVDHTRVHEAVVVACRAVPLSSKQTVLFFEVPSSTEWQVPTMCGGFTPNWFVNISDTIDIKLDALGRYEAEIRPWPHARSIEAVEHLARWRGASVGMEAAEGFVLGRKIEV